MRSCGDCNVCCIAGTVPSLGKPAFSPCRHIVSSNGGGCCSLHGTPTRPLECETYACLWLRGMGVPDDRPDLSKVMCSANKGNGGDWVFVIELEQNAAMTTGRDFVERLTTLASTPVIVVDYGKPESKGDRVIVKDQLRRRCGKVMGTFVCHFDDDRTMGVYELVVH